MLVAEKEGIRKACVEWASMKENVIQWITKSVKQRLSRRSTEASEEETVGSTTDRNVNENSSGISCIVSGCLNIFVLHKFLNKRGVFQEIQRIFTLRPVKQMALLKSTSTTASSMTMSRSRSTFLLFTCMFRYLWSILTI